MIEIEAETDVNIKTTNNQTNADNINDKKSIDSSLKSITLWDGISLIIGTIIGSGIFITPNGVLSNIPSLGYSIVVWISGGLLTILGSLCYGELGASIPSSGGEYIYFLRAYHPSLAYAILWTNVILIRPLSIAIGALYIGYIFVSIVTPNCTDTTTEIIVGCIIIISITCINCLSIRFAISMNNVLTYSKFLAIFILVVLAIIHSINGYNEQWIGAFDPISLDYKKVSSGLLNGLYAYDGWNTLNFVTNELQNPSKNLPLAIIISLVTVIIVYVITIVSFSTIIGKYGILASTNVTSTVASMYMGKAGVIMSLFVIASIFGSTNGTYFSGGRLFYAAAQNDHLPKIFGKIHRKTKTMAPALILQSVVSFIILFLQQNDILIEMFGLISWISYLFSFIAVIILRIKEKDLIRPYKVPIIIPYLSTFLSIIIIVLTFINDWKFSLASLSSVLISFPVYFIFYGKYSIKSNFISIFGVKICDYISNVFDFYMPESENDISG